MTHKLILESELWHHATTGKSMLLLYRFHFLDVCRHFRTCCACTCKDYVCIHSQPSSILCQEKLVKNPPTHSLAMAAVDLTANPPEEIPAALQAGIDKLSSPLKTLLMGKVVPYIIQHRLGEDCYVTIEDLADRWGTPQIARTNGPAELGLREGDNGFTAKKSSYASMKLYQVVRAAKDLLQQTPSSPSASGTTIGRGMPLTEVLCERSQLEKEYMAKWNVPKPQYRDQGSEAFLKRQYRFCSKGEIGHIQVKHIISALPEEGERPLKTRRKESVDGWEKEEEEEERAAPTTRRQLERLHLVFRNALLMCMAAFPQFPQFDLMDAFYDWFYGPKVAGRRPSPSDQTLLYAERNAWREMHELMHSGLTLKQAMKEVKEDSLFWMRDGPSRIQKGSPFAEIIT